MKLKNTILEKIASLYDLVSRVDKYWARVDLTKSTKKYNSIELEVDIYTFLEEETEEDPQIAHIIKEKVDLLDTTAIQNLDYILEDVKKLINSNEKEEAECQID